MSEKKTIEAYTGEARNAVLEFKKLVAALCGVDIKDVEIKVEVNADEVQAMWLSLGCIYNWDGSRRRCDQHGGVISARGMQRCVRPGGGVSV